MDYANGLRASPAFQRALPDDSSLVEYLGCCENGKSYGDPETAAAGMGPFLEGNGGVGTFGGSEDHAAIMTCKANSVLVYGFCPTRLEREVSVHATMVFVVASSGVVAAKTAGAMAKYNTAASDAQRVARTSGGFATMGEALRLRGEGPCRETLQSATGNNVRSHKSLKRFHQFALEATEVVPGLADALESGDLAAGGRLMDLSHAAGADALTNLVEATAWLPKRAKALGACGATAFGAGFGGSVVALVPAEGAERFRAAWERDYRAAFPENDDTAAFFVMRPGPGATRI